MANAVLPSSGEYASAIFDGVARVRLCENLIEECAELLDLVEAAATTPEHRGGYVYRNSKLTRVRLLERQNRLDAAILTIEEVIQLAKETTDRLLYQVALLTKAEILQQLGRIDETLAALDLVAPALAEQPPDLWAHYDRILACALLAAGETGAALPHLHRARRLYESIRSAPGLLELSRRWDETLAARANGDPAGSLLDAGERPRLPLPVLAAAAPEIDAADRPAEAPSPDPGRAACGTPDREAAAISARDVLQTAAGLLRHHSRPELVARELVHLLGGTGTVAAARALSVGSDGDEQVLAAWTADPAADTLPRRFSIGIARDRAVELELRLRPGIEARATAHTVALLLATIRDLESARVEREERLSLWPSDEDEAGEGTVAGGQMRSLMAIARRIATTNVSVLITGESGTGKEVLARAIHRYSDRAAKPFVPFNCAAVPRDMLESQLFGYRRGSFTGADRDHPGVIGAARDGTLFLDEIGELGLDLQPKLLRFLESGEVCPIGESTPFTLSVRVIAATNADIEQHVREGRFREDLFYRLNVIRLQVPPLRERRDEIPALVRHFLDHAAGEFRKGNVTVSEETMEHLLLCRWPGNVRQLQNEIRRMVALAEPNAVLAPAALSPEVFNARLAGRLVPGEFEMLVPLKAKLQPTLAKVETAMIRLALRDHQANLNAAAAALGISRKGLYLKRQRLGL